MKKALLPKKTAANLDDEEAMRGLRRLAEKWSQIKSRLANREEMLRFAQQEVETAKKMKDQAFRDMSSAFFRVGGVRIFFDTHVDFAMGAQTGKVKEKFNLRVIIQEGKIRAEGGFDLKEVVRREFPIESKAAGELIALDAICRMVPARLKAKTAAKLFSALRRLRLLSSRNKLVQYSEVGFFHEEKKNEWVILALA